MSYESQIVRGATGYVPGRQLADGDVVKLNTNENPYPPCREVMDAIAAVTADALRRYPTTARR